MTENSFKSENPFKFGLPANPKDFIGRKELLRALSIDMKKGQNISLHSERRTGKSSLLKYIADPKFASEFELPDNHISVYIDFQGFGLNKKTEILSVWRIIAKTIAEKLHGELGSTFTSISNNIGKEPIEIFVTNFGRAFSQLEKKIINFICYWMSLNLQRIYR